MKKPASDRKLGAIFFPTQSPSPVIITSDLPQIMSLLKSAEGIIFIAIKYAIMSRLCNKNNLIVYSWSTPAEAAKL